MIIAIVVLAACSENGSPGSTYKSTSESAKNLNVTPTTGSVAILTIPAPNPGAMEADVASLINKSWKELNATLADNNITPQARAEAYAKYGLVAFGNGLTLPAEVAFKNAAQLAPDDARWRYFLALMHTYNGALDDAAINFEHVLELLPGNLPTLLRLAEVRFEQAQVQSAEDLYQQALNINTESAAAHYGLGRIANANGQHRDAIKHFEAALKLQPQADRINYFLGLNWRDLGDRDKAKAYLAQRGTNEPSFSDPLFDEISGGEARIGGLWAHMNAGSQAFVDGNYTLAVNEFKLATQDLPNDSRSWQSLGMALNKTRDTDAAKAAYSKALNLSKNNASIHHELAKILMVNGELEAAEKHLLRAIVIDPQMLEAHTTLARVMANNGRMNEALKQYNTALVLDPQSIELAVSRANALIALDRSGDAERVLAETIRVNPLDATLRVAYGLVLAETGNVEQAMLEIERALKNAKDDPTRGKAHYAMGQLHLRKGDVQSAVSSFGSALRFNPDHRAAGLELARSFLRLRDFKQALATYTVLINKWPNADAARVEAARVAVMLGDGPQAKRLLQAGAEQKAVSARLLGSLARLLVLSTEDEVRDPDLAFKYAQRALKINPTSHHAETIALCKAALNYFDEAVTLQKRLINEAGSQVTPKVRARMEKNLERYRNKSLGRLPFDAS